MSRFAMRPAAQGRPTCAVQPMEPFGPACETRCRIKSVPVVTDKMNVFRTAHRDPALMSCHLQGSLGFVAPLH